MPRIRNVLLPDEQGLQPPLVVDATTPPIRTRPPLLDAPVAFVFSSLEEAGVPVAERRFEVGETIYSCGDSDRNLYFLTEGVVTLYKRYAGHKEDIVAFLEEGSVLGEPTPRTGYTHRDSATAAAACRIAMVSKAALERHVQRDPRCALALLIAYAQWAQRHERAMERLIPREIRTRLAVSLLELADKFGEPGDGGVVIGVHLIHQTLAEMTVSSRVGVSKEMARFRREGLIEAQSKGRIVLLDEARLNEIARST
jgi:CRP/FNR family transcriptional regulator, cyclic AMP receptor protein